LLLGVFVEQQALRLAAAANVDANTRVAVAGEIRMRERISLVSPVALAVWEIFQERGNRLLFSIVGQPDAGRHRRAVLQRNQRVLDNTDGAWKSRDNHRDSPGGRVKTVNLPLSVNDSSRNHGTVQCNPTQARQIDIPVIPPDSEP